MEEKKFYVLKNSFTGEFEKSECGSPTGELFYGTNEECDAWIAKKQTPKVINTSDSDILRRDFGDSLKNLTAEQSLKVAAMIKSFEDENMRAWLTKESDYVKRFWTQYCDNLEKDHGTLSTNFFISSLCDMYSEGGLNALKELLCRIKNSKKLKVEDIENTIKDMGFKLDN